MADKKEESVKKLFKLGEGKTMFWDPTQPKEAAQKLLPGEVKELDLTKKVMAAKRGEHIIAADEEDLKEYQNSLKKAGEKKDSENAGKKSDSNKA